MPEKPMVLVTNPIHPKAEALLSDHASVITAPDTDSDTLRRLAANAAGIIVRAKLPDDIVDCAPKLVGIVRHGVGLDFIPVSAATARGVPVANLPGVNSQAVAEYCLAAALEMRRFLASIDLRLRQRGWGDARSMAGLTSELGGATLGIVGVGVIGSRLAAMARRGFGMKVLGSSRRYNRVPDGVESTPLDTLFSSSDIVVLTCPLTEETRGLVDERRLALMKPDALLINVSRGPVVDTAALVEALKSGVIGGAAVDVYDEHPVPADSVLLECPRLLMTPHIAGLTSTSIRAMGVGAAEEMLRILRGQDPVNLANPEYRDHQTDIHRGGLHANQGD